MSEYTHTVIITQFLKTVKEIESVGSLHFSLQLYRSFVLRAEIFFLFLEVVDRLFPYFSIVNYILLPFSFFFSSVFSVLAEWERDSDDEAPLSCYV